LNIKVSNHRCPSLFDRQGRSDFRPAVAPRP
jgi:hypothetical protein